MLKTIRASPNRNVIHINRDANRDFMSTIGKCGPFYVSNYTGNPLLMLKESYTQIFDIRFARLIDVYDGKISPPKGIKEPISKEISGCGVLFLVIPPTEGEWWDLEMFLKDMTSKDHITDPFQKDSRKASRLEDMFFLF